MKTKFTTNDGKTEQVDCELVSQTGGVLVLIENGTKTSEEIWSVTHTPTGAMVKSFLKKRDAQQFARSFYCQLSKQEQVMLKTETNPKVLMADFLPSTRAFVRNWKPK